MSASLPYFWRRSTSKDPGLFFRSDVSFVHASSETAGDVFGKDGTDRNQARVMGEIGFIFGHNVVEK